MRLRSRLVALLAAGAVLTGVQAPATAGSTAGSAAGATAGSTSGTPAALVDCARTSLAGPVTILARPNPLGSLDRRQVAVAIEVASVGQRLKVPARGQAIALTAALTESVLEPVRGPRPGLFASTRQGDVGGPGPAARGLDARGFYQRLTRVRAWQGLPPTIAAHRALGSPDPYRYESYWEVSLRLLQYLTANPRADVASAVSTGAALRSDCLPSSPDAIRFPVEPGSAYSVRGTEPVEGAADKAHPGIDVAAACGVPVIAATGGKVRVITDQPDSGPWLIEVTSTDDKATTRYAHVQSPLVADGDSVTAGQPVAQVGDFANPEGCGLHFDVNIDGKPVDPAAWLATQVEPEVRVKVDVKTTVREAVPDTTFRMATFNVLGSHHTDPGGKDAGLASGPARMAGTLAMLEARQIDVVTLNEFETPQANVVLGDGDWGLRRATPNNRFRNGNAAGNAIAWRSDVWAEKSSSELVVPWQVQLHMPVVFLEHRGTGAEIVVIAVHNPASTKVQGNQARSRAVARSIEAQAVARLGGETGDPVFIAGDFNERNEVFCHFTTVGAMSSSAGGSVGAPCRPPPYGPVDWIFGRGEFDFTAGYKDTSTIGRLSDHPIVITDVFLPGRPAVRR